jgi:hypothetical protein
MTDTTTVDEPADGQANETVDAAAGTGPDVPADEHIAISGQIGSGEHKPVKDRLLLPLLVPVLSAAAVGLLAVNISRVFLAGNEDAALISATVITLAILGGASLLAAAPRMRTSSLAMVLGLVVVIIVSGGLLTLGPSINTGEGGGGGYIEPTAAAVGEVDVQAISVPLSFNAKNYDAPAGIVDMKLGGDTGHTLAFRETIFSGFELGPTPTPPLDGKVELKAGTTYNVYCTIPGHAAAGMEATITVAAG